jgi:hypothetical protein
MTNYKDLVLKIHPTAECKKMVSVINGTQYYILVPQDLGAITMTFRKDPDEAWKYAYLNYCRKFPADNDNSSDYLDFVEL